MYIYHSLKVKIEKYSLAIRQKAISKKLNYVLSKKSQLCRHNRKTNLILLGVISND